MVEVKKEEKEKHVYLLEVTVEEERVQEALKNAYRDLSSRVNIPGFRKGRAPWNILKTYLGKGAILDSLARTLIPQVTREVLEQEKIEVIGEPEMEILHIAEDAPLVFRLQVIENPTVLLPHPEDLEARKYRLEVRESDIERELERLRVARSTWKEKEKESVAISGDLVKLTVQGRNYTILAQEKDEQNAIAREVLGMKVGESKKVALTNQEGEATEVEFQVTGLMEKEIPQIDQEFLRNLGSDIDSLETLRDKIRESLERLANDLVEERFQKEAIVALGKHSTVHIPAPLLELQTRHKIDGFQDQLKKDGLTLERYLELTNTDFATVEKELRKVAHWELKKFFVLQQYAKEYAIEASDEDLDKELERLAQISGRTKEDVREILTRNDKIEETQERLKMQKLMEHLTSRVKVKTLEEPLNFDQWKVLENPEEEMIS